MGRQNVAGSANRSLLSDSEMVDNNNCGRGVVTVRGAASEAWQHVKISHRILIHQTKGIIETIGTGTCIFVTKARQCWPGSSDGKGHGSSHAQNKCKNEHANM